MSNCFQAGLVLVYAWVAACAFLLMLQLSGIFIPLTAGWLGMAGWLFFCFSSYHYLTDLQLLLHGKVRKPIREEKEKLQRCLDDILLKASIDKTFRLMIEEEMAPNAFAAGRDTIVVTKGILEKMTDDELKGVLAHELGHLMSKDTRLVSAFLTASLLFRIMATVYKWVSRIVRRGFFPSVTERASRLFLRNSRLNLLTGVITLLLLGWLLHRLHLLQAVIPVIGFVWISYPINILFTFFYRLEMRHIEYRRDDYAFRLGFGTGLRQALQKLTKDPQPLNLFFIILRSSHPVIYNRIRRLEKLEGSL